MVTMTLTPPAQISNLTCILWSYMYICVPKIVQICETFDVLKSRNVFVFFFSDLDID